MYQTNHGFNFFSPQTFCSGGQLKGTIPESLGQLKSLEFLGISKFVKRGEHIQTLFFVMMLKLFFIFLRKTFFSVDSGLTGTIPSSLAGLTKLTSLGLCKLFKRLAYAA